MLNWKCCVLRLWISDDFKLINVMNISNWYMDGVIKVNILMIWLIYVYLKLIFFVIVFII